MTIPVGVLLVGGCGTPGRDAAALPDSPVPCASRSGSPTAPEPSEPSKGAGPSEPSGPSAGSGPSGTPSPRRTKMAWRAEEMPDGSVRMTIGDVGAAPRAERAVRTADHTAPERRSDCDDVHVIKPRGWWCTTTVDPIKVRGEIVLGGAEPRARIGGDGFETRCRKRPRQMRQTYQVERDSWSGWRGYGPLRRTDWTSKQKQDGGAVSELCPKGRTGRYNYRLTVTVEIRDTKVGHSPAASARIRTDCGTGIS